MAWNDGLCGCSSIVHRFWALLHERLIWMIRALGKARILPEKLKNDTQTH
ncbi:MAG: hypothetical protein ACJAQT_004172 [Akkermansiaceae bacterium]|jgi:hypothetical protein